MKNNPQIGRKARVKFLWGGRLMYGIVTDILRDSFVVSPLRKRLGLLVSRSRVILSSQSTPIEWIRQ